MLIDASGTAKTSAATIWSARIETTVTFAGISGLAGALAGIVWGGFGGRVAMRVVFLTSSANVKGLTSDDGFEIGTISAATIFLLFFTAIVGGIAGFLYGVLRMVTFGATWLVAVGVGIASAAGAGALIVHTNGVDFRFLDPLWLAVGLFVAIPAAWGVTVVYLGDWLMAPGRVFPSPPERTDPRWWGAIGWLVICFVSVAGTIDLVSDVGRLN
jgi:hypothetical protein